MEHAETKYLERAPARGPNRPAHGRSPLAAPLHAVRPRHRAYSGAARGHNRLGFALRIRRQGEIRGRSSEGRHYRMAGLNLLAAIVINWNTAHPGEAVRQRKLAGLTVEPELWRTSHPLGGATSCSPANTGGQSVDSSLSVRFCPLLESTRSWECWNSGLPKRLA